MIIDEIEYETVDNISFSPIYRDFLSPSRLTVAYEKAKEYLTKITTGIDQQINIWQYRQQILREQLSQTQSSPSYDFLLPKTQRINELTLEAVQCSLRTRISFPLPLSFSLPFSPLSNRSINRANSSDRFKVSSNTFS